MRHRCPQGCRDQAVASCGVLQHADDARGALIPRRFQAQGLGQLLIAGRNRHRYRPGVRNISKQSAQGHDPLDAEIVDRSKQLGAEAAPAHVGLDASDQDDVTADPSRSGERDACGRPVQATDAGLVDGHMRPVDLEVVVILGVDLAEGDRLPAFLQVLDDPRRRLTRVVPPLEGGDEHGIVQVRNAVQLHRASSNRSPGQRTTVVRLRRSVPSVGHSATAQPPELALAGCLHRLACGKRCRNASSWLTGRWARCCRPPT